MKIIKIIEFFIIRERILAVVLRKLNSVFRGKIRSCRSLWARSKTQGQSREEAEEIWKIKMYSCYRHQQGIFLLER